jgi:hypothetical protein
MSVDGDNESVLETRSFLFLIPGNLGLFKTRNFPSPSREGFGFIAESFIVHVGINEKFISILNTFQNIVS